MRLPLLLAAALLVGPLALTACSNGEDLANRAREAIEDLADDGADDGAASTYPRDGVFTVVNDTETDVCDVQITDFDEPDNAGYDLLEAPLAPGDSLRFPYGSHAETDDHNLIATAVGCDGGAYGDYHFSYHHGGGTYTVHEYHAED